MSYEGYSGECCFSVSIERYKDPDTGKYYSLEEAEKIDPDEKFEIEDLILYVEGNAYYIPGYFDGLPENCYPDESDVNILSVVDEDNNDWMSKLDKSEIDLIENVIIEEVKHYY